MSGLGKFGIFLFTAAVILVSALWIMGGRPHKAMAEVWVSAEPDEVFSWLVDPEKRTRWVQNLEKTAIAESDTDGTPVKFVSTFREGDRSMKLEEIVQQHDAARFLSLKYESGGIETTRVFRIEPEGKRVRLTFEMIQKSLNLWRLKHALQATDLQAQIQSESAVLKKLAEKNSETPFLFGEPIR